MSIIKSYKTTVDNIMNNELKKSLDKIPKTIPKAK